MHWGENGLKVYIIQKGFTLTIQNGSTLKTQKGSTLKIQNDSTIKILMLKIHEMNTDKNT